MTFKKKLILHIGMPKTGTTTIQQTLARNNEKLLSEGFYYPPEPPFNHSYNFSPIFLNSPEESIHFKRNNLKNNSEISDEISRLKKYWIKKFNTRGIRNFVISAEGLTRYNREEVEKLYDFVSTFFQDIKIIVYVRPPLSAIKSNWQQNIKQSSPEDTMESILKKTIKSYNFKFIERWKDVFGKSSLIVRPFDPKFFFGDDLIKDFLYFSGSTESSITSKASSNTSLGQSSACLLFHYNRHFPIFSDRKLNTKRGLANDLEFFYSILREVPDEPLNLNIKLTEKEAQHLNNEIDYINSLINDDEKLSYLEASSESTKFPRLEDIPATYLANLINTYNKRIDELLN